MTRFAQSLLRIRTLILKEFLTILKDPKSRTVVILPPLVQFFVFAYAATFDLSNVRFAVLDEDRSAESRALVAYFEGSPTFRLVRQLSSDREIAPIINDEEARLVVHVPPSFGRDLHGGGHATLQVILDGRNSNVAGIATGYVSAIVDRFNESLGSAGAAVQIATPTTGPSLQPVDRAWFNANLSSRWYIVAALPAQITTVVVLLLTGLSVSREREFGTFDQLLVSPFRPGEILIGKAVPPMTLGLMDAVLLSLGGVFWYHVPFRGSVVALGAALLCFVLCVVGVGLFISSLCSTMQQSLLGSFVFIMPAVILSGFTTAIENMPTWLQVSTYLNPLRYIVAACREIFLQGGTVRSISPQLWPLAIIAAVTLAADTWLFRHRAE
ncbi:MAG: ABC transporter permease [Tepidisphaeraceae bacterium]